MMRRTVCAGVHSWFTAGDRGRKFIIDMQGVAHTFALKYVDGDGWKRFDNGSENGYNVGANVGVMGANRIAVTWE